MKFTKLFQELNKNDANMAGGKGASLGEMTQAGIPVPGGFVVLSTTFDHFLHETDLTQEIDTILKTVDHKVIHTVDAASEKIRGLIENQPVPEDIAKEVKSEFQKLGCEFVAVRSSATAEDGAEHAWAGQLESFLNTDENTLLDHVRKCWGSLFTPRAIFYRFEKDLHGTEISVAVVVQKMVQSEVSGIAFSVHPITEDYNQLIIEAGYGLGEAIVSGSITPDSYVVEKNPRQIIDKNVSDQRRALVKEGVQNNWVEVDGAKSELQKISDEQVLELSEIIVGIEKHYGFPCDIEWAFENGKFYIVQSRPITTLSKKAPLDAYNKFFTRDFSLAAVEFWYRGETISPKGWTEEVQPHMPYIAFERKDDTVACYYNQKGVDWCIDRLLKIAKEDKDFISNLCKIIPEKLSFIRPLYEKPKAISHEELLRFLDESERYYPWFEAMWWLMELTPEQLGDLDVDELREIRKQTNDLSSGSDIVIRKSLEQLFPEIKDYVHVLTTEEIKNKSIPDMEVLKKRDAGYIFTDNQLFVGVSKKEIGDKYNIKLETLEVEDGTEQIKGLSAYKGVVRGKVRRVMGHKQIPEIQAGEILVSPMTMPDFLPAMEKASAFVTDEGGITCHASIIAREMKKPCIVGTKIATKVLQDGMEVEVDADNGIVRII